MKKQVRKIYALYRGEKNVCDGTISEISAERNIKRSTLYWLSAPSGKKRQMKHKNINGLILVFIGNE